MFSQLLLFFHRPGNSNNNNNPMSAEDTECEGYRFKEKLTDYGRKGIRLMRMRQEGDVYYIKEFVVDVKIKLATHDEYKYGNNSMVFPTDTIQNRINALAKENEIETAEQFALDICQNHLDEYEQVINCVVYIEEVPWRRMDNLGSEHNHAFLSSPEAIRFAEVEHDRDGNDENITLTVFSGPRKLAKSLTQYIKLVFAPSDSPHGYARAALQRN
ncbi:uricase-like [Amphiura filiformis]|uniref:uricase-like n=1 Tax=Amphiura filiformis TaxID=82378 RepID=UPI003B21D2F7